MTNGVVATPDYQLFPSLSHNEYTALRQDILDRGVLVPVEVDDRGVILDGHHRAAIAAELGIEYPVVERTGMTEAEKLEHVFALNIARRHLGGHDRTAVISLCKARGMSLRAIAALLSVSHETVRRGVNDEAVTNVTPDVGDESEPEPIPPPMTVPTRRDRARAMRAAGETHRTIAESLGVSQATVGNLLSDRPETRTNVDIPADWTQTKALIVAIKALPSKAPEPRVFAQSVPERNRASTAVALRKVGTFLGSIARELERSES